MASADSQGRSLAAKVRARLAAAGLDHERQEALAPDLEGLLARLEAFPSAQLGDVEPATGFIVSEPVGQGKATASPPARRHPGGTGGGSVGG